MTAHGRQIAAAPQFIWVEMRCRRLDRASGEAGEPEVVAVMRDVTERKMQEQALDHARAEADQANAAKVKFLANMSHELRTPLNAIIGFSDMLMNEERMRLDGARRQEYAKLINDSGAHLLAVVNGILDMSKMETGDFEISPEPFAPAPGDRQLLRSPGAEGAGVRARSHHAACRADLPEITADKRAFKQILLNLISNAVKFTDRGGRVTVAADDRGRRYPDRGRRHRRRHQRRRSAAGRPAVLPGARRLRPPPRRHRARAFDRARAWWRCTAAR